MNTVRAFGFAAIGAGGAGVESFIELWNPATSNRVIKVTSILINTDDTVVKIKHHTSQQGSAGTIGTKGNKLMGGVAPSAVIYGHGVASVSGTQVFAVNAVADIDESVNLNDAPLVLDPGVSLIIENTNADLAINNVDIEWHEIDERH